jgi:hypothetical protein
MRSPYAPSPGHGLVTNADVVDGTHVPRITTRQPFSCTRGAGSGLSLPHESVRSPTENRKVGGSTPPLATTPTAGQTPSGLRFCHFQGHDSGLSIAGIDRQIPRFAVRCGTRCCNGTSIWIALAMCGPRSADIRLGWRPTHRGEADPRPRAAERATTTSPKDGTPKGRDRGRHAGTGRGPFPNHCPSAGTRGDSTCAWAKACTADSPSKLQGNR